MKPTASGYNAFLRRTMPRFNSIARRLESLEIRIIERSGPWPPAEGSFGWHLWQALARPSERRGSMEMYMQRAADHWRSWK